MKRALRLCAVSLLFGSTYLIASSGCSASGGAGGGDDGGVNSASTNSPIFASSGSDGGASGPCTGLQCQVAACPNGASTTVSGTVYDPAAKNPLYNVVVYIPNAAVQPLTPGASCDSCDALYTGSPIASALTDATGKFTLTNVPAGTNVPIVVQIGKWRRQTTISTVVQCQNNAVADKSLRLPKNHTEGDIPSIAVSTGDSDSLECLLLRVGLDAAEYGPGATGAGRIHIFQGGGADSDAPNTSPAAPQSSVGLWDSQADLMKYDVVLLSCEGDETANMNQQAMFNYAAAGGRVFASHFHYAWFNTGPYASANLATWSTGTQDLDAINANIVTTLPSGQPFPKGQALQQWLGNVNALTNGELPIQDARDNASVTAANTPSQAWIAADADSGAPNATQYFTFNTPLGAPVANQCGRVVFSDLHVGAASNDYSGDATSSIVPTGCAATDDLSPQEKALEFMLFDLSSCVTSDSTPPAPPPTLPPVK